MATSEEIAAYPPELIKQLYDAGQIDKKQARLALKLKETKALRNEAGPRGQHTQRGGYVAASPLSHLARGIRNYKGDKSIKSMEGQQGELAQQQADARAEYFKGQQAADRGGMYQGNDVSTFGMPEQEPMGRGRPIQPMARPAPPPAQAPVGPASPTGPGSMGPVGPASPTAPRPQIPPPQAGMAPGGTYTGPQPSPTPPRMDVGNPAGGAPPGPGGQPSMGGMSPQQMQMIQKWLATQQGGGVNPQMQTANALRR